MSVARGLYALILLPILSCATAHAQPADVNRILRSFDFEERRLGNVEALPMHWSKVDGGGLPHYVNGRLATDRARGGKHSFKLELNGGSLVYRYESGQIKVERDAHYRVEGFVQTTPMPHARARAAAYFADLDGHPLMNTVRHSPLLVSHSDSNEWLPFSIELSATDPNAACVVIELELLNPTSYLPPTLGRRTLYPQDIYGCAWFDDITVSQVPKVTLSTDRPGNIFRRSDTLRMNVLVNDRFTDDLSAQLVVRDATGRIVHQRSGALDMNAAQAIGPGQKRMSITLPEDLPTGWYEASLEMSSQGAFVGKQSISLIRLGDDARLTHPDPRFGLIATSLPFDGWSELPEILPMLSAGRVKLGVWTREGDVQRQNSAAFDSLLERLGELQITPTACLIDLPPNVQQKMKGATFQSDWLSNDVTEAVATTENAWLRLLKAPADTWKPQLAEMIARHANHLERWQLGDDGTDVFVTTPAMRTVYAQIYTEFANLVQKPDLAMPWPAWYELDGEMPATVALYVKADVLPSQLPLYMAEVGGGATGNAKPRNLSVYLEPLDVKQYGREMQIRDLAQRIAYALSADASRIDLKLPFTVRRVEGESGGENGTIDKQPQELFMIVRTIMTVLGNAQFKGKVPIADGVEAFLFDRNGQGILMLWNRGGDADVKQLALNLGERPMCVDLWGNITPLLATTTPSSAEIKKDSPFNSSANSGGNAQNSIALSIGPTPVFLVNIDGQLAQLRASVGFDNDRIESSFKPHTRRLRFTNPYKSAISGTVKLTPPKGWTINPPTQSFALNPGETFDREITIEFPYNSFAGPKTITASFNLQAESSSNFVVPLLLKLGLSDVGLQTMALRDGNDVIVQQMITNYGERPIDYSAYAIFPGQARQERLVTNLAPGRTTIKKYRFNNAAITPNAKVRSGVKELVGNRVLNDEVAVQ